MNRREAIKRTSLLMGGMLFAPTLAVVFSGCTPSGNSGISISADRMSRITRLSDLMIPSTSTPGALDAGVPAFIERMVSEVYSPEQREKFVQKLDDFTEGSKEMYGDAFMGLNEDDQIAYMEERNRIAVETYSEELPFILIFKELCLTGFCLSEQGANSVLRYMQTPGKYEPCMPFEEVGKTWAT